MKITDLWPTVDAHRAAIQAALTTRPATLLDKAADEFGEAARIRRSSLRGAFGDIQTLVKHVTRATAVYKETGESIDDDDLLRKIEDAAHKAVQSGRRAQAHYDVSLADESDWSAPHGSSGTSGPSIPLVDLTKDGQMTPLARLGPAALDDLPILTQTHLLEWRIADPDHASTVLKALCSTLVPKSDDTSKGVDSAHLSVPDDWDPNHALTPKSMSLARARIRARAQAQATSTASDSQQTEITCERHEATLNALQSHCETHSRTEPIRALLYAVRSARHLGSEIRRSRLGVPAAVRWTFPEDLDPSPFESDEDDDVEGESSTFTASCRSAPTTSQSQSRSSAPDRESFVFPTITI